MTSDEQRRALCKIQYDDICREQFDKIISQLDNIEKRLFIDNGKECIQSKINRHDGFLKVIGWTLGVIFIAVAGVIVKSFI